jgi:hypothetical protein
MKAAPCNLQSLRDNRNFNLAAIAPEPGKTVFHWAAFGVVHRASDNKQRGYGSDMK